MPKAKSKRVLDPGRRARVLIVDDSMVARQLVAAALGDDPCLEVVGVARNGKEALEKVVRLTPDVVTLDIEMPEMDGFEALRNIRRSSPQVRVVMLSRSTERGSQDALEALTLGADDYVTKVNAGKSADDFTAQLRDDLGPKIKQFFIFQAAGIPSTAQPQAAPDPAVRIADGRKPKAAECFDLEGLASNFLPRIVAIGISTGGPSALASILQEFPKDFFLPILIVQHMPQQFTKLLCERLQATALLPIREAVHGELVKAGLILVAPGNHHMRVAIAAGERHPRVWLDQGPPENSCRPAVDPLFESIAQVYRGSVIAAILTGMGHDGLRGARLLKAAGAAILAQDEATSTVWGMPRAIAESGIADAVLPLNRIIPQILHECRRHTRSADRSVEEGCHG